MERQGEIGTPSVMCDLNSDKIRFIYQPFINHFDWPTNFRADQGGWGGVCEGWVHLNQSRMQSAMQGVELSLEDLILHYLNQGISMWK